MVGREADAFTRILYLLTSTSTGNTLKRIATATKIAKLGIDPQLQRVDLDQKPPQLHVEAEQPRNAPIIGPLIDSGNLLLVRITENLP
jgi:hypothetical protein